MSNPLSHSFEQAQILRDRKLRRYLLTMLFEARGKGGPVSASLMYQIYGEYSSFSNRIMTEDHATQLLSDLVAVGVAREISTRKYKDEIKTLENTSYTITDTGIALMTEAIDPIPTIEDPRI